MDENFDARDALNAADDSRHHLADRLVTPLWYHPAVGLSLVAIAYAIGMPEGTVERRTRLYLLLGTVLINALILPWAYKQQTGVWIQQATGPRSRRLFLLGMIPLAAFIGGLVANYYLDGPTWVPLTLGALAFVGTLIFGHRYDNAVRADLRTGEPQ